MASEWLFKDWELLTRCYQTLLGARESLRKPPFKLDLRRLAALISIQHHLEVMHLEFEHDDLGHTSPHTHTVEHGDVLCAATG